MARQGCYTPIVDIKFAPSNDTVALAIRCQRGLNTRLYAAKPAAALPAGASLGVMYNLTLGLRNAFAQAPSKVREPAAPDSATLERARSAIGSKLFRVMGTLARRKSKKQTLPILQAGKFDPALETALTERLGIVTGAPDSKKFLIILAEEFSAWADEHVADLEQAGISRLKDGRLVLAAAAASPAEPAAKAESRLKAV